MKKFFEAEFEFILLNNCIIATSNGKDVTDGSQEGGD